MAPDGAGADNMLHGSIQQICRHAKTVSYVSDWRVASHHTKHRNPNSIWSMTLGRRSYIDIVYTTPPGQQPLHGCDDAYFPGTAMEC
eukprot:COSAG01_NODE_81_length_27820_cov_22.659753_4_plen_87_part_00